MADDYISKGSTIRELERLRKKSSSVSEGRLHWKKDDELHALEGEYNRLKKQKEELLEKAQETSLLNELQNYIKKKSEGDKEAQLGNLADEDLLFKAVELTQKKKIMETYNVYRLTGVAFVVLSENSWRFCLDTFYQGQYFEPYYMEIQMKEDKIKILKHTIPFFIPLDEILKGYKGSEGLKEFVFIISCYLNSFVYRRQQFLQVQEVDEHYNIRDIYLTAAFDFVKFILKLPSYEMSEIVVKMKYSDLNDRLPTEVDLKMLDADDDNDELLSDLQEKLLSMEVKKAILAVTC